MDTREIFEHSRRVSRRDFRHAFAFAAAFAVEAAAFATLFEGGAWMLFVVPSVLWGCIATTAMHRADAMDDCIRRWDEGER